MTKNVLITGASRRIGASCARLLHAEGCNILIHYKSSEQDANKLCHELNSIRADSAKLIQADLLNMAELEKVAQAALASWGGVDVLINNASSFYPTPLGTVTEIQWDDLLDSNLKAPFFLNKLLSENLGKRNGCIINMVDIHAERGLPQTFG
jgi:pteridine reductase